MLGSGCSSGLAAVAVAAKRVRKQLLSNQRETSDLYDTACNYAGVFSTVISGSVLDQV